MIGQSWEDPLLSAECDLAHAREEIAKLKAIIDEALDFARDRHDVVDGDYGVPAPNDWMMITDILEGR